MPVAVLIAPLFDNVTSYSYAWSRSVQAMLVSKGYNVIDLSGRQVKRDEVERYITLSNPDIVIFYDHGNEEQLFGSSTDVVIDKNNIELIAGKSLYTMACLSGKRLGVLAWKYEANFWGYNRVFMFTTDASEDFKMFANMGILLILDGKSWEEAYNITRAYGYDLARKLASEGKIIASVAMMNNVSSLVCYTKQLYPGESGCVFRRIALKLLGRKWGWRIKPPFIKKKK